VAKKVIFKDTQFDI